MADFALPEYRKLITRKIWVIEKSWNFQTVVSGLYISDFDTHEALLQIPQSSNAPNSIGSTGIYFFPWHNIDIFFYFPYLKVLLLTSPQFESSWGYCKTDRYLTYINHDLLNLAFLLWIWLLPNFVLLCNTAVCSKYPGSNPGVAKSLFLKFSCQFEPNLQKSAIELRVYLNAVLYVPINLSYYLNWRKKTSKIVFRHVLSNSSLLFTESLQVVSHECTTAIPNSPNLVRQSSLNKTENRLTRISLAIVWVFIFCHIWKLIPTMYEAVNWFTRSRNEVWTNNYLDLDCVKKY